MIPRWLAIVGTVVLVIIAIILFSHSDNPTLNLPGSSNSPEVKGVEAQDVLIVYAGGAFSPTHLSITAGQEVVFQDSSDQPMQIASNPYPYDNDLPGLNSPQVTRAGGTYTYVFARAGTFGYHNELAPGQGGSVTVQEPR
jgi:plastocyanin